VKRVEYRKPLLAESEIHEALPGESGESEINEATPLGELRE
jgi:hypothetical protein